MKRATRRTFIIQFAVGIGFLIIAFSVLAFGEPSERGLGDWQATDLDRRLRDIELARPRNLERLAVTESQVANLTERLVKLELREFALFLASGLGIGGSSVLTYRMWRKLNGQ